MEDENVGDTLLNKKYYENCPGCKVDKAKELKTDVTFRNLLNIWMVVLCSCKLSIQIMIYLFQLLIYTSLMSLFFVFYSFTYSISLSLPIFHGNLSLINNNYGSLLV